MFPIEIVSHLARLLSLTVRLYANMFAGEQVTLVFLSLTKFLIPVVFMGLHVFVGVVQAYIFMLLTMVYVGGASRTTINFYHPALSALQCEPGCTVSGNHLLERFLKETNE